MAVGLTTILTSVVELLFEWAKTGRILPKREQHPTRLFVDCSNGVHRDLRLLAEQSMEDFKRRIERFPVTLMALRLVDPAHDMTKGSKTQHAVWPYGTD